MMEFSPTFVSSSSSIYKAIREMKKEREGAQYSLYQRLKSIQRDKDSLLALLEEYEMVLDSWNIVGNLRCGSWYLPPSKFSLYSYFKSTDGHAGEWKFSLSRLNLHIAEAAGITYCVRMFKSLAQKGGVIIIDSTKKGKKFPDSFSRTIPIWTCVLNRTVIRMRTQDEEAQKEWNELHLPPWISPSEKTQIESLLEGFVKNLLSSGAHLDRLVSLLQKPLRVLWDSPYRNTFLDDEQESTDYTSLPFTPVVCISVSDPESTDNEYIQGAADDEESWAKELTPALFWENEDFLLDGGPMELEQRVAKVISDSKIKQIKVDCSSLEQIQAVKIGNTGLYISTDLKGLGAAFQLYDSVLNCSTLPYEGFPPESAYVHLAIAEGKQDKHKLSKILPDALAFAKQQLEAHHTILIHSFHGTNAPVCICLAILLRFFSLENEGTLLPSPRVRVNKALVKQHFLFLEKFMPQCRPPRVMMTDINRFFMSSTIQK